MIFITAHLLLSQHNYASKYRKKFHILKPNLNKPKNTLTIKLQMLSTPLNITQLCPKSNMVPYTI